MTGDFTVEIPAVARAIFAVVRPTARTCRKKPVSKSFQKAKRSPITHGQSSKRTRSLICGKKQIGCIISKKRWGLQENDGCGRTPFSVEKSTFPVSTFASCHES